MKTHCQVTLDVFVYTEENSVDVAARLAETGFMIDPDNDALDEVVDVVDIAVEDAQITDSR